MKAICASGPIPKAARQEIVINRRSGLPRHHVAPCDKGWTAKRTSRHQKGGRTMTHHGLTRLAALLATGVATRCFMTVRSEEHTSELPALMANSDAVFWLKK